TTGAIQANGGSITSTAANLTINAGGIVSIDDNLVLTGSISDSDSSITLADDVTITGSTLLFNNAAADISTGANQNLTISANGTGELTLGTDLDSGINIGTN